MGLHKTFSGALIAVLAFSMSAAEAAGTFGAIAYSRSSGAYGYSHGFRTRGGAEARALRGCTPYARDCQIVAWFSNMCGALAVGRSNGFGYAYMPGPRAAEASAFANCSGFTTGCRMVVSFCSP